MAPLMENGALNEASTSSSGFMLFYVNKKNQKKFNQVFKNFKNKFSFCWFESV